MTMTVKKEETLKKAEEIISFKSESKYKAIWTSNNWN